MACAGSGFQHRLAAPGITLLSRTSSDVKRDIFLCHTGADKDWVRQLAERLEAERLGGRPVSVWFDEWDIDFGEQIITKIDEGLRTSHYVGVILSPTAARAPWPNAEWQSQIMADPINKSGRIIPILRHKFDAETGEPIDLPFALKPLKWLDFTDDRRFEASVAVLLRRLANERPVRGSGRGALGSARLALPGQDLADVVDESLPSNLFPVLALPEWLYGEETPVRQKGEVWRALTGARIPPFVLHGTRLYSFYAPDDAANPFTRFFTRTSPPTPERVSDWLADVDRARALVGMLNTALREHCFHLRIRTPKDDRTHYYCPIFDEQPRMFRWGTTGRERTLAKLKPRPNGTTFGVHMSAKMRFITVGARLFLLVEPGWLFTSDGSTPLQGPEVGRYSTMWNGPERNATVLRNVLMWGLLLSGGSSRIEVGLGGAAVITVQSVPAHTQLKAGLDGDSIRLDRILGGEGAGETPRAPGVRSGGSADVESSETGEVSDTDELDRVADLALVGALDAALREESERHAEKMEEIEDPPDDEDAPPEPHHGPTGAGRAEARRAPDDRDSQQATLELPF